MEGDQNGQYVLTLKGEGLQEEDGRQKASLSPSPRGSMYHDSRMVLH